MKKYNIFMNKYLPDWNRFRNKFSLIIVFWNLEVKLLAQRDEKLSLLSFKISKSLPLESLMSLTGCWPFNVYFTWTFKKCLQCTLVSTKEQMNFCIVLSKVITYSLKYKKNNKRLRCSSLKYTPTAKRWILCRN